MNFNKVILAGHLTRDVEKTVTPKGTVIASFGIAINRHWTTEGGEKREEVTFLDCKAFGRQAETIAQYVGKGSALLVEGRITREEWADKTGEKRSATRILVESFQFLGRRKETAAPAAVEAHDDQPPY